MRLYAKLHMNLAWCLRGAAHCSMFSSLVRPLWYGQTHTLCSLEGRNISAFNGPHDPPLRCLLYTFEIHVQGSKTEIGFFFPAFGNFASCKISESFECFYKACGISLLLKEISAKLTLVLV